MLRTIEGKLLFWFVVMLIVLLANTALSYRATRTVVEDEQAVSHSHEVLAELESALSTLADAETGQRGYLITGVESYLDPYKMAIVDINHQLLHIGQLTADNPRQRARHLVLRQKSHARIRR